MKPLLPLCTLIPYTTLLRSRTARWYSGECAEEVQNPRCEQTYTPRHRGHRENFVSSSVPHCLGVSSRVPSFCILHFEFCISTVTFWSSARAPRERSLPVSLQQRASACASSIAPPSRGTSCAATR